MESLSNEVPQPAQGNQVILKIIDYPGEGAIIHYVGKNVKPTMIQSEGLEAPMYEWIKQNFPDLKKVAGAAISIACDESGLPTHLSKINDPGIDIEVKK